MRRAIDPFRLLLVSVAGWMNQQQQDVVEYLKEENQVLREQLGNRRLCLSDDERRRLAAKAKKLGRKVLHEVATIVTPETLLAWHRKLIKNPSGSGITGVLPQRILATHLSDEFADLFRHRWPSGPTVPDLPGPEQPEALPMPGDNCFWLDDHERGSPIRPSPAQPNPEETIRSGQFGTLRCGTLQDTELVAECHILQLKRDATMERRQQRGE